MPVSHGLSRSTNGVACVASLLGVVVMGLVLWGGVIWVARAFLPFASN